MDKPLPSRPKRGDTLVTQAKKVDIWDILVDPLGFKTSGILAMSFSAG